MKILFVSGPNINLTGVREKEQYGEDTYEEFTLKVKDRVEKEGVDADFFQSNHEGELVDVIQNAMGEFDGIVINPGAYTHTSVAIRDALLATRIPVVEVHMSNVYSRESFRKKSTIEDIALGKVCGFGWLSYYFGAMGLLDSLGKK